jgi:PAS domain S-box-containing protein
MANPLRVLIIEDVEDDALLLLRELRRGGYDVTHACVDTPSTFREVLTTQEWDIVVSDYSMPQFSGLAALRIIQETGLDLPFIVMSGTVGEDIAVNTMKSGAHDYLMKNNLRRLIPAVQRELREATMRRERREAEQALRASEERFRALSESSPLGIFLCDTQGRCLYVNARWLEITGLPEAQSLGLGWRRALHPEDRKRVLREWDSYLQSGYNLFETDVRFLQPSGAMRWGCVRAGHIRDEEGHLQGYTGTVEDITERKTIQEQLLQAQKLESLGRLAGGIAHDFNNLLTAMLGYAEMVEEEIPSESSAALLLKNLRTAGGRAVDLVAQLLAFARKQVIAPRVFDLNTLLDETDPLMRRLIGEHIQLSMIKQSDLWYVKADPGQCQQILLNLVVNARDAMPDGGRLLIETGNVMLGAEHARHHADVRPGAYVMLAVQDTGIGMDQTVLGRIFEPFFTTKGVQEGTGLGLATCYGIVTQNDGHIQVESELGKGTTFKIYLPRVQKAVEAVVHQEEITALTGSETLLVVEDDTLLHDFTVEALRTRGYKVLAAHDGREALQIAQKYAGDIHLLVTDVVMPHIGGGELATRLREMRPEMRVLFVSGYIDSPTLRIEDMDPKTFLQKPFSVVMLARKVRELLA